MILEAQQEGALRLAFPMYAIAISLRSRLSTELLLSELCSHGPVLLDFCPTFAHIAGADECGTEGVGAVLQGQSRGCKSSRARSIH